MQRPNSTLDLNKADNENSHPIGIRYHKEHTEKNILTELKKKMEQKHVFSQECIVFVNMSTTERQQSCGMISEKAHCVLA